MRRTLASTLAATTTLAGAGSTLAVDNAAADSPSHRAEAPNPDPDLSTLESCTAKFGLTKANSRPIVFDPVVSGPVTPVPELGAGITPVVTLTMADSSIEQCIAEPAWTDEATWLTWIDTHVTFGSSVIDRPAVAPYLVPGLGSGFIGLGSIGSGPGPVTAIELQLILDPQFRADFTVTHPGVLDPFVWANSLEAGQSLIAYIRGQLDPGLLDEFDGYVIASEGNLVTCEALAAPSPEFTTAMLSILPDSALGVDVVLDVIGDGSACNIVYVVLFGSSFVVELDDATVEVQVESLGALPPTGNSPSTALLAGLAAAIGGALLVAGRRRRTA